MLRYALYARKSDERREVTEKSTSEQTAECRALAPGLGTVVREFAESRSARVPGVRPLFDEMLRMVRSGQIDAILCWKVDRLARNMREGGEIAQLLIDGKLREIRTPHACYRPGDNILPLVLETATSAQYSLDLRTNVVRGLAGHFERGGWNARAPQGYRNGRDPVNPKVGTVERDEPRFSLLRKGWDMMLTGAYGPGQVAETLNGTFGYRTRRTVKGGGTPMSRSYAYKVFTNPFYAGYTLYKGELRPGSHEAMVTEAEFGRVQEILGAVTVSHAHVHEFAYTGLMRCGHCGSQVTAELHRVKAKGGTTRPYRFYRCSDSKGHCTKKGLAERQVEDAIGRALAGITVDVELCGLARENLRRSLEERPASEGMVQAQQEAALADVEAQQGRLVSLWLRGLLTDEERFRSEEARLAADKRALLLKVGACREELARMRANAEACLGYLEGAQRHFLVGDAKRRREIASALASSYSFFGPERRVEVSVKPLLTEMARYARDVEAARRDEGQSARGGKPPGQGGPKVFSHRLTFEPRRIGSGSVKSADKMGVVLDGRGAETVFDPDQPDENAAMRSVTKPGRLLLEALRGELFSESENAFATVG